MRRSAVPPGVVLPLLALVVLACTGSTGTSSPPNQTGSLVVTPSGGSPISGGGVLPAPSVDQGSVSATASPAPSPRASPSSTPSPAASDPIDFTVDGTIGGKPVSGPLNSGAFTMACEGSGCQALLVHWTGTASGTGLQGEIDFKPGTWTIGSASAQGTASIGLAGGKAIDSLAATSGTVTTGSGGGTIDATFSDGGGPVHLSGTWTCSAPAASG
jgi:hypothetical protein